MTDAADSLWFAAGAVTAIILGLAAARMRCRRWLRRHSYVATVEVVDHRPGQRARLT
jgi:hypothetical protein